MRRHERWTVFFICGLLLLGASAAQTAQAQSSTAVLQPWLQLVLQPPQRYGLEAVVSSQSLNKGEPVTLRVERFDAEHYRLMVNLPEWGWILDRDATRTMLALPDHQVVFVGEGPSPAENHLAASDLLNRLISVDSMLRPYWDLARQSDPMGLAMMFESLAGILPSGNHIWTIGAADGATLESVDATALRVHHGADTLELRRLDDAALDASPSWPSDWKVQQIDRAEMEWMLFRGVRRATEVVLPGPALALSNLQPRRVPHGQLQLIDGQPVVQLWGNPQQIGQAQGQLLSKPIERCFDSIMLAGCAATVNQGTWFMGELRAAYARLEPHIPASHIQEMDAIARAAGIAQDVIRTGSVFPELFHCSGFALFGSATADGTLYHGRVLDYMTEIGLQDAAVVFVVRPDGKHAFLNVGYAGFVGSVTGMNDQGLGLGEMGGGGVGDWDGVPMATLMRRGLEECASLDDLKQLFSDSPRTCEYYYVFSDAKIPDAVGVYATPAVIEFIAAGQADPRLGSGIEDVVCLSAGSRLEKLRERIMQRPTAFDAQAACHLMDRPVAMKSNLHNALMVPGRGVAYVANATSRQIAAERPYVRIDFQDLLAQIDMLASDQP